MAEPREYTGFEREQVFVKRDSIEWSYCVERHRDLWFDLGEKNRRVPQSYQLKGDFGWWFPAVWVREFIESRRSRVA